MTVHAIRQERHWCYSSKWQFSAVCLFLCLLFSLVSTTSASEHYKSKSSSEGDEYLEEILAEERRLEEEYRKRQQASGGRDGYATDQEASDAAARAAQAERERMERIRAEREARIEQEMNKLDEEARKKAQRQQRADGKLVKRILKNAQAQKHYAVLGLRNRELQIGPLIVFGKKLRPIRLFHISKNKIRRAYRNRALAVHPDKNLDGRAQEAFVAVEESASLLSDELKRRDYDAEISAIRRQFRQEVIAGVMDVLHYVRRSVQKVIGLIRGVLGPFATPIFILGALLVP